MLSFYKYHGLGNDFVLVDARHSGGLPDAATARRLCDRHTGIGADGVVAILPAEDPRAQVRMALRNADGTRAAMCGNAIRCLAWHLVREAAFPGEAIVIETAAGLRCATVRATDDPAVGYARVTMGAPSLDRRHLPMVGTGTCRGETLDTPRGPLRVTALSMGNPHLVVLDPVEVDHRDELGPWLSSHPLFPAGVNVGFLSRLGEGGLRLVVYERGVGFTQACGTGACAAAVAALLEGWVVAEEAVTVELPGGRLAITVAEGLASVTMAGEAAQIFRGTWGA